MKIFQIGFNRCGTSSIFHFFKNKCEPELKCLHWTKGDVALQILKNMRAGRPLLAGRYENHDVFTDMQVFFNTKNGSDLFLAHVDCYKIIDDQYPGSRFILNTRNVNNWVKSRLKHYSSRKTIEFFQSLHKTKDLESAWIKQWEDHHEDVVEYFKNRKELLVFDIEKDKGEKIANFLPELSFKSTAFPKISASAN